RDSSGHVRGRQSLRRDRTNADRAARQRLSRHYTWPQTTKNQAALVALNGRYSVTDHWTVQSNLYYRRFNQQHLDGTAAEIERCSGAANNPLFNTLCLENDAFPQPRPPAAGFQILNQNSQPIPCPPGSGNTCATTPWGTVDRTFTKGLTTG